MPDRDHEVRAHEDVQLAEVDLLRGVQVAGRAQDHEQRLAVALQFGSLVCLHRVLDGQRVEVELRCQGEEFALGGAGEADPGHAGRLFAQFAERVGEGVRRRDAHAVPVEGGLDDAARVGRFRGGASAGDTGGFGSGAGGGACVRRQPDVLPFLPSLPFSEVGRARRWGIAVPLDRAYVPTST